MGPAGHNLLSASDAAAKIAAGELTSEALVADCLGRIKARDPEIGAWTHVDADHAIEQARRLDRTPRLGPLHGIPVGVKPCAPFSRHPGPVRALAFRHRARVPRDDR
jgi:Asp-tRNA(Asn)/Glu-tRNA(Gln) amidotransferase A subunit family amidase